MKPVFLTGLQTFMPQHWLATSSIPDLHGNFFNIRMLSIAFNVLVFHIPKLDLIGVILLGSKWCDNIIHTVLSALILLFHCTMCMIDTGLNYCHNQMLLSKMNAMS